VALQRGSYAELLRQGSTGTNVLGFYRGADGERVVVVINPGGDAVTVMLPIAKTADAASMPEGTLFVDALGEGAPKATTVKAGALALSLPARTMGIYVAK
jgi:hypothetical protein